MKKRVYAFTEYCSELINYGGEIRTRGYVMKELQNRGVPQRLIDYYMIGNKGIGVSKKKEEVSV